MNRKVWDAILDIMDIVLQFMAVLAVEIAVFSSFDAMLAETEIVSRAPAFAWQLSVIVLPVVFWMIREKADRFLVFTLLHVAVTAAAIWILGETPLQKILFGAIAVVYMIYSFYIRLAGGDKQSVRPSRPTFAPAIAAFLAYLPCVYLGLDAACTRLVRLVLLYALFFLVDMYLLQLDRFIQFNRASNAHIPVRKILSRGGGIAGGLSVFVVAMLWVGTDAQVMQKLSDAVSAACKWIAKVVLKAIALLLSLFGGEEEAVTETVQESTGEATGLMDEAVENPLWWEIFLKVMQYLVLAAGIALLVWLLAKAVRAMIKKFYEARHHKAEDPEGEEEIREKLTAQKRSRGRRGERPLPVIAGSNEDRIRRIYYRTVVRTRRYRNPDGRITQGRSKNIWLDAQRQALIRGRTARELIVLVGMPWKNTEGSLFKEEEEQSEEKRRADEARRQACERLAELYGKARYKGSCTREEVRAAQECSAEILR